ncbi:MAG: hypothetical protein ACMUIG_10625, partial [Thermoplasmatota archaeon]
ARYGDDFEIIIRARDNFGVANATVEYWFDDDEHDLSPMRGDGDFYSASIKVGKRSHETLHFRFIVEDVNGNVNITVTRDVDVIDEGFSLMMLLIFSAVVMMVAAAIVIALVIGKRDQEGEIDPEETDEIPPVRRPLTVR